MRGTSQNSNGKEMRGTEGVLKKSTTMRQERKYNKKDRLYNKKTTEHVEKK